MLVPGMTSEEIRHEVYKDYPCVYRKAAYVAKKVAKNFGPIKDKVIYRVFDYYSPAKNNWIYSLKITKTSSTTFMLAYHYNKSGLHAYGVFGDSDYLMHFTTHFFARYNQRQNLGLELRHDIMQQYAQSNFLYSFHKSEEIYGQSKIFCITDTGLILGDKDDTTRFINARTFLPFRLLTNVKFNMMLGGVMEFIESIKFQMSIVPIQTIKL